MSVLPAEPPWWVNVLSSFRTPAVPIYCIKQDWSLCLPWSSQIQHSSSVLTTGSLPCLSVFSPCWCPYYGQIHLVCFSFTKKKKKKIEITNVLAGLFRHGSGNRAICPITPSSLANRLFRSDVPSEREHQLYSVVSRPDTDPPHHGKNVRGMSHCNLYWASEMRRSGSSENL